MKRVAIVLGVTFCAVLLFAWGTGQTNADDLSTDGPQFKQYLEETTTTLLVINSPASATSPAVRLDPPTTPEPPTTPPPPSWSTESRNGHCVGFEGLLAQYSPGWSVSRMSGIMYRESRCQPDASNSCCSGLLQIHRMHIPIEECNVWSRSDLYNPVKNICAAAWLWRVQGYGGWSTS